MLTLNGIDTLQQIVGDIGNLDTKINTANTNIGTPADSYVVNTLHGRAYGAYQHGLWTF